jgi:hypothetical protein
MQATMLRRELEGYIDAMPVRKLYMIKPLLKEFAKPDYTVEPASPEEAAMAEERIEEYYKDSSSFVRMEF